jgi:hypothetical protein
MRFKNLSENGKKMRTTYVCFKVITLYFKFKDHVPVDQCVIDGHNSECDFYTQIQQLEGCPIPNVFRADRYLNGIKG